MKNLKYNKFDETDNNACIYGLLTGDSWSKRAQQIQKKSFAYLSGFNSNKFKDHRFDKGTGFTALEKYLMMVSKIAHKEIFRYLKGKTESINLDLI